MQVFIYAPRFAAMRTRHNAPPPQPGATVFQFNQAPAGNTREAPRPRVVDVEPEAAL